MRAFFPSHVCEVYTRWSFFGDLVSDFSETEGESLCVCEFWGVRSDACWECRLCNLAFRKTHIDILNRFHPDSSSFCERRRLTSICPLARSRYRFDPSVVIKKAQTATWNSRGWWPLPPLSNRLPQVWVTYWEPVFDCFTEVVLTFVVTCKSCTHSRKTRAISSGGRFPLLSLAFRVYVIESVQIFQVAALKTPTLN